MKNLTLKWKISLFYLALPALFSALVLFFIYLTISNKGYADASSRLQTEIARATQMLEIENGTISLNNLPITANTDTYLAIYSNNNVLLLGSTPPNSVLPLQPSFGNTYTQKLGNYRWMICDNAISLNGQQQGWLRAAFSLESTDKTLGVIKTMLLLVLPFYLFIALLGAWIVKQALSPVVQITKTAKQICQGDLTKRVPLSGARDELGIVAKSLNEMLDSLEDSINREKRFSSDVSHELRAPVAAISISAQEALHGEKTAEAYRESLNNILQESRTMTSLISQLLCLARSTDGKYVPEMEAIDISTLTGTIVDNYSERSERLDISISADIEAGITMLCEQTLFMRLLMNLIDNALKFNVHNGWVKVSLHRVENIITLSVEDGGIGISEEALPKIWDRFFKVAPSSANFSPGLGLPIVKWIADLHGGTIYVKSKLNFGSLFEIRFQV